MDDAEHLDGGNVGGEVVRVGDTVRKRWSASTAGVVEFVTFLRKAGVDAPTPLGRDESGRQVQEFIPGTLAIDAPALSLTALHRVGSLVRAIHEASSGFEPRPQASWETAIEAPGAELMCHNDLAPWNLIMGDRWVFIDWDAAAPSTRLWDTAYAAQAFTLNDTEKPPEVAALELAAFVDGYGADPEMRRHLPSAMAERASAMHDLLRTSGLTGHEPWASMIHDGHGAHWEAAARYVRTNRAVWATALAERRPTSPASSSRPRGSNIPS